MSRPIARGSERTTKKYSDDKKRMDEITEKIANREPLKEWAALYWMAVAIGHILEWIIRHNKQ